MARHAQVVRQVRVSSVAAQLLGCQAPAATRTCTTTCACRAMVFKLRIERLNQVDHKRQAVRAVPGVGARHACAEGHAMKKDPASNHRHSNPRPCASGEDATLRNLSNLSLDGAEMHSAEAAWREEDAVAHGGGA